MTDPIQTVLFPQHATKAQLASRADALAKENVLLREQLAGALNVQTTYSEALDEALQALGRKHHETIS
jgi:hypothetical protein